MNVKETYVVLPNNKLMPCVGYGTWQLSEQEAYECVLKALKIGYKHIDTAFAYENEESVACVIVWAKHGLKLERTIREQLCSRTVGWL